MGAGLPVIGTLKHLLETGDKAQTIEGIFSGTLSYIFNTFGDGRPFSEIVSDAKAQVRVFLCGEGVDVCGVVRLCCGGRILFSQLLQLPLSLLDR